jgi:integrase
MHSIFNHSIRWEWYDGNPITRVRQSAKRQKVPIVLNIEQIKSQIAHLKEPGKTAVFLDTLTGLRVSELLALKWSDVDFENLEVHVLRSIALHRVGPCKTEASQNPVPLDPEFAEVLLMWRRQSPYPADSDWVLANPAKKGRRRIGRFPSFACISNRPSKPQVSRGKLVGTPSAIHLQRF